MKNNIVKTSKFLSLILRHRPETIGLRLDSDGWLEIDALIRNAKRHGHPITRELLRDVVKSSDKQRFAISDDGLRIRANQGHSIAEVDLNLPPQEPPTELYHGTVASRLDSIRFESTGWLSSRETTFTYQSTSKRRFE